MRPSTSTNSLFYYLSISSNYKLIHSSSTTDKPHTSSGYFSTPLDIIYTSAFNIHVLYIPDKLYYSFVFQESTTDL